MPGQAEAGAATALLPAPAQPARQCGGACQIYLLPKHPVLMVGLTALAGLPEISKGGYPDEYNDKYQLCI